MRRKNRNCIVTVKIPDNLKIVILINGEHNLDKLAEETITEQTVTSLLKRKVTNDPNVKLNKHL